MGFSNSGGYTGIATIEISMDVFSESGVTQNYPCTYAALAAGCCADFLRCSCQ